MTLAEAHEHVGAEVVYKPHRDAVAEAGVITWVSARYVFVRYVGDRTAKATQPEHLTLAWLR